MHTQHKILRPASYTNVDGGKWTVWPGESITEAKLTEARVYNNRISLEVGIRRRLRVYSIRLVSGREWDCINGWRS